MQEIVLLRILDPLQDRGIAEEGAGFFKGQQVLVEILDHRAGVALRNIVDTGEVGDILVAELEELFAPQQFLLGEVAADLDRLVAGDLCRHAPPLLHAPAP
jgi:hypothetical protein